jgi:hypothetical protein
MACGVVLAGFAGWFVDERRTRRRQHGRGKPVVDLEPEWPEVHRTDDDHVDRLAEELWTDAFLDDLGMLPVRLREPDDIHSDLSFLRAESDRPAEHALGLLDRPRLPLLTRRLGPAEPAAAPMMAAPRSHAVVKACSGGRRYASWWLALCLMLAALFAGKASLPPPTVLSSARSSPTLGTITRVSQNIENVRVGQRVVAHNPNPESSARTAHLVDDPSSWRRLRLQVEELWRDGTVNVIEVETLQPPEWIEEHGAKAGAAVPLPFDLLEMGLPDTLRARVLANEPCPVIAPGLGCVVLTTVNRLNSDLYELTLADRQGHQEMVRPTGLHKFYSADRQRWVNTRELREGERLRGIDGWLRLVHRSRLPGVHRVYNITVSGEHVFHVSSLGLLSHNVNPSGQPVPNRSPSGKFTEPTLPNSTIVNEGGVRVRHYTRGAEHPPAHAHVTGEGPSTRIGANGKPLAGDPALSPAQKRVVDENLSFIRSALNKVKQWWKWKFHFEDN